MRELKSWDSIVFYVLDCSSPQAVLEGGIEENNTSTGACDTLHMARSLCDLQE